MEMISMDYQRVGTSGDFKHLGFSKISNLIKLGKHIVQ